MKAVFLIFVWSLCFYSCGHQPGNKVENVEQNGKRSLKIFSEADVAGYAIAVYKKNPDGYFEVKESDDGFLVIDREGDPDSEQQCIVKIGAHGLILRRSNDGQWIDRFGNRRIFYYEEGNKLVLSEIFEGDSTTYYEFTKEDGDVFYNTRKINSPNDPLAYIFDGIWAEHEEANALFTIKGDTIVNFEHGDRMRFEIVGDTMKIDYDGFIRRHLILKHTLDSLILQHEDRSITKLYKR